jgi:hypothetical protein
MVKDFNEQLKNKQENKGFYQPFKLDTGIYEKIILYSVLLFSSSSLRSII